MNIPLDNAVEMLEARMKDNPKSLVFARLADLYLDRGRIDDAIALCNDSVKFHPYYVSGYFVLAKAFIAQKDLEKAEVALKKVLSHDQQYPAAHKLLGDILCKTNRDSLAGAHYEDVLFMDPLEERVRKALERIPKETLESPPLQVPAQKPKIEPIPQPRSQFESQDESWMDQIKEFRPEEEIKPAEKTGPREEAAAFETEIADPFADLVLFDEKEKETAPEDRIMPVQDGTSDLPQKSVADQAGESTDSAPLIGETPEYLPPESEEKQSPYLTPEMLPEKSPETGEPLGLEHPEAEPFNVALTGFAPSEESRKTEESAFHSVLNEPGILDDMEVVSEPTLLDDFQVVTEQPAQVPARKPESGTSDFVEKPAPSVRPTASTSPRPPAKPPQEAPPSEPKPSPEKKLPKIVTPTLGEIYAVQGQYEKAILVYQALLEKTPNEKKYLDKIEEMKKKLRESAGK